MATHRIERPYPVNAEYQAGYNKGYGHGLRFVCVCLTIVGVFYIVF